MKILMPVPAVGFDPTESAIPWRYLKNAGHKIIFSTPDSQPARADERMLTGQGLGPLASFLMANKLARQAYSEMEQSQEFLNPVAWAVLNASDYDALVLVGGHAPGMIEYLESTTLQKIVVQMMVNKPVGAICHGVVLAARSKNADGKSVLFEKNTTSLLKVQELSAWAMTVAWLKNYYRTYTQTVEDEVKSQLKSASQFYKGPLPLLRDHPRALDRGYSLTDGNYVSARWPGDAHAFAVAFERLLTNEEAITSF